MLKKISLVLVMFTLMFTITGCTKEETKSAQITTKPVVKSKKGLSFKEKREYESLETEIADLEKEKNILESKINEGISNYKLLQEKTERVSELMKSIDNKEQRWLDLDELA